MSRKKQLPAKPGTANKQKDNTVLYVAIIGLIGTIITAIIGSLNILAPIMLQMAATQTAVAEAKATMRVSSATPSSSATVVQLTVLSHNNCENA